MNGEKNILVISEELLFVKIFERMLAACSLSMHLYFCNSFTSLQSFDKTDETVLVIVDDVLSGTAPYEIVNFLRLHKTIECPLYYFSAADVTEENKALKRGVSRYFKKPFNPEAVFNNIEEELKRRV